MRPIVFTFCALLSISYSAVAADASYTLVNRWQVHFGRGEERATYRTAVCPDGTFYLADSYGRVAVVDATGKVTSRRIRREFLSNGALACDAESRLYIANMREILVLGNGTTVSRMPARVDATAIAPTARGLIYAAGSARANALPLHLIDSQGAVVNSFGIHRGGQFNRMYPRSAGYLLWQEGLGRLLYIPRWHDFEIQAYKADGSSIGIFGAQGAQILPVRIADAGEPALGLVAGAALLPNQEIAIQREVAEWRWGRSRVLEIYDSNLRRLGTALSDARDLAGAAADGDLYFTTLSPRGLQVFKMGLVKRLSL
jgi:hypothetical protein